ncbi:MAG: hypothetical protein WCJ09_21940 [Planctomycetota bacterium]
MELKERGLKMLDDKQKRLRDFIRLQPNHPFSIANRGLLDLSSQNTWNATGVLSMTGVLWWALNFTADLAYPNVIMFNATGGPDADLALFTSAVTGTFYVDPSTLNGSYNFKLQAVTGGVGEVSIDFYDTSWNQMIGSFVGAAGGLSLSVVSGTGTMKYNP